MLVYYSLASLCSSSQYYLYDQSIIKHHGRTVYDMMIKISNDNTHSVRDDMEWIMEEESKTCFLGKKWKRMERVTSRWFPIRSSHSNTCITIHSQLIAPGRVVNHTRILTYRGMWSNRQFWNITNICWKKYVFNFEKFFPHLLYQLFCCTVVFIANSRIGMGIHLFQYSPFQYHKPLTICTFFIFTPTCTKKIYFLSISPRYHISHSRFFVWNKMNGYSEKVFTLCMYYWTVYET